MGFHGLVAGDDLRDAAARAKRFGLLCVVDQHEVDGAHPQTVFHLNAPVVDGHQDVLEFAEGQGSRCLWYILSVHDQPTMTLHGGSRVFTEVRKTNPLHTSHLVPEQRYGAAKPHELLARIVVNRALDDAA